MKRSVEWKVEQKQDGGYYLTEREAGTVIWHSVRRRGLFGNRNKEQFQSTLAAYEQKLALTGVSIIAEEWSE